MQGGKQNHSYPSENNMPTIINPTIVIIISMPACQNFGYEFSNSDVKGSDLLEVFLQHVTVVFLHSADYFQLILIVTFKGSS